MTSILKKFLSAVVALITLFSFSGCNTNQFDEEQIGKDMEGVLTQLFQAVQNRDQEKFQTFFADHVIELDDFEYGSNYVFDLYQGEFAEVNFRSAGHTGDHLVPGEQICYAYMTFIVSTSEAEYLACIEFYTKYESKYPDDPYKIRKFSLLEKQDDGSFEKGEGFSQRYGIYYPGWLGEEVE